MPYKTRTLEIGEKAVLKRLPSFWQRKDFLSKLNTVNVQLGLNKVSPIGLSRIRKVSFPKYPTKSQGENFA
jgi:hypothetical protein